MNFQHPEYFIGIILIPLLIFLYFRLIAWKKKLAIRIGDPTLVSQLVKSFSAKNFLLKFILICVAVFFLVAGLANLRAKGNAENISRQGVDVMIVLDVSKSMLAQDVKPNRLDKAKQLLIDVETAFNQQKVIQPEQNSQVVRIYQALGDDPQKMFYTQYQERKVSKAAGSLAIQW